MVASARPARSITTVLSPASAARALVTRAAAAPGKRCVGFGQIVAGGGDVLPLRVPRGLPTRAQGRARDFPRGKKARRGGAASGLLSGVHPDSVEAARIVEKAQAASDQWRVETTAFLDPRSPRMR